jgi:hypothetical protein
MATIQNLTIEQGTTFEVVFTVNTSSGVPEDLTGAVARCQMRRSYGAVTSTELTTTILSPETNGEVKITLTAVQTAAIKPRRYVYDLIVTKANSEVVRVVEGIVTVSPGVTR